LNLPHLLLMAILEVVPARQSIYLHQNCRSAGKGANIRSGSRSGGHAKGDRHLPGQAVHAHHPADAGVRQCGLSVLPFVQELDNTGHTNTWIGQFHQGLLEQMYQNRVIFLLNMSCPVYCRFCFRKHKDSRNETNPTPADVEKR
jgi:lysine 2,3-aminomutase